MLTFENKVQKVIDEVDVLTEAKANDGKTASVGIVKYRDKWLLGLSTAHDERANCWSFPGGTIKNKEGHEGAAVREVKEETGVTCKAISGPLNYGKKEVAFIACQANSDDIKKLKPNHEYTHLGWFSEKQMKSLKLMGNVKGLIAAAKKV